MRAPSVAVGCFLHLDLQLVEPFRILPRFVQALASEVSDLLEIEPRKIHESKIIVPLTAKLPCSFVPC
jgi:hypothetical protein